MKKNTVAPAVSTPAARTTSADFGRQKAASARRTRRAMGSSDPSERFVQEILCTFGPRWEW